MVVVSLLVVEVDLEVVLGTLVVVLGALEVVLGALEVVLGALEVVLGAMEVVEVVLVVESVVQSIRAGQLHTGPSGYCIELSKYRAPHPSPHEAHSSKQGSLTGSQTQNLLQLKECSMKTGWLLAWSMYSLQSGTLLPS